MPFALRVIIAIGIAVVILLVGFSILRSMGAAAKSGKPEDAEDVSELAVYFVCRECGTEFRVTRLGETQVPRHCGEVMQVVRRPWGGEGSAYG